MSEWRETTLGEICKIKHGYAFKGDFITTESQSYILLTPGNFKIGGGLKFEKNKYFTGEIPEDYVLKSGDLVVTMTDLSKKGDTLGYTGVIPDISEEVLHNQRIGLVTEISEDIHKDFLHWRMRNYDYQLFIVGHSTGTTVKHTSPKTIHSYTFANIYPEASCGSQPCLASISYLSYNKRELVWLSYVGLPTSVEETASHPLIVAFVFSR